jgi:single-strand DNA-binding protein
MYLNNVELIGFLGADADSSKTTAGITRTRLSLATKTRWLKDGEQHDRTEWHVVIAWNRLGDYAASFKKGSHIRVEGAIASREFQNKEGNTQKVYEIVASSILSLRSGQRLTEPPTPEPEHFLG